MVWVTGSALAVGEVVRGQRSPSGRMDMGYHHPFLVIAKAAQQLTMRNCTSHPSASFTTLEIIAGDKAGDPYWNNGSSSYLVTNGDLSIVPVSEHTGFTTDGTTVQVEVQIGPTQLVFAYVDQFGTPFYSHYRPTALVTQPRIIPVFSDVEFNRVGSVAALRMAALVAAL